MNKYEDKLLKILEKHKIKKTLFFILMKNYTYIKSIKIKNIGIIDFTTITSELNYIEKCCEKYKNTISKYSSEGKKTDFLISEYNSFKDKKKKQYELLLSKIDEYIKKSSEIIFYDGKDINIDIHVLLEKGDVHSTKTPAIYSDDYKLKEYFLNGIMLNETEWLKDPSVRADKLNKLLHKH